jgi:glycosyltransferase involved in cell wall biosynthesis
LILEEKMTNNHRIKVVHVCTVGVTALRLLLPQCTYFREQGLDVSFVFSPGPESMMLWEKGFPVKEIKIEREIKPFKDLVSIWQLRHYFCQLKPDIVHTHTSKAGLAGRIGAWLAGVPIIIHTVHGFPFHEGMPYIQMKLYQNLEKLGARLSTAVLSQSKEDVENAAQIGIKSKSDGLVHIGNGIDVNKFNPKKFDKEKKLRIRQKFGLKPDTLVLTTVARVNPLKGYMDLIDAIAKLPSGNWHLLCVGEDEGQMEEIKDRINRLALESKVSMLGIRDDIPEIMSITDIYILASYREGVPRSVIEAQAMEIPAVVTNVRGSREVVIDGKTGFIVPPHDPENLAIAINNLMVNRELRYQFGRAGRQRVLAEFNEEKVFERIFHIYLKYLSDNKS